LAKGFDTSIDWNAVHKKLEELKKTRQIGYCIHWKKFCTLKRRNMMN